ncbi:MAG: sirohydrochlorin chelatase [candidate division NC10 bacterium]|nr:sirohydrochlorin chelatase [candidate division NC10 bacterium]MBI2114639.1 sirohydrochlorin chelatase [candidate division NC10 bacterium]MBI3086673.1 sirohydrochlorin chelatase [candidate division NC10 bacterium]
MMAEAVLLVGHGSREAEGNAQFEAFVERVRPAFPGRVTRHCYIELATPGIPEGIDQCVAQGAARVVVLPVILFSSGHAKLEIPYEIDEAQGRHPGVDFRYARPLGVDPRILAILDERLAEAAVRMPPGDRAETAVLLVGRGSSDPDANGDLFKIARMLWEGRGFGWVETCFIGIAKPDYPTGIWRCVTLGARRVIVVPYMLFTGVLVKRMEAQLEGFRRDFQGIPMVLAGTLGGHPKLIEILVERHREALEGTALMNCLLCKYRMVLTGHEHEHYSHRAPASDLGLAAPKGA